MPKSACRGEWEKGAADAGNQHVPAAGMVCDTEPSPAGTPTCDAEPFPDAQERQLVPAAIAPGLLQGKRCFSPGPALGCPPCTRVPGEPGVGCKPLSDRSPGGMEKAAVRSSSALAAPGLGWPFLPSLPPLTAPKPTKTLHLSPGIRHPAGVPHSPTAATFQGNLQLSCSAAGHDRG